MNGSSLFFLLSQHAERDTRHWLERAVIGLNLCPFARTPYLSGRIHYAVSAAETSHDVLQALDRELKNLVALEAVERETTLLVLPLCLGEFLEFNDLLPRANRLIRKLGFEGDIQLASFHPKYQFADTAVDDVTNCTNRSPYPTLQLLREASVARAVEKFSNPESIYEENMKTLQQLGFDGWAALRVGRS